MKKLYAMSGLLALIMIMTGCSKRDLLPSNGSIDVNEWMRAHEKGTVAYVDYYTGNYIVDTYNGYSVIESWGGSAPREYDEQYAYFGNRGLQTIYNWSGNYFTDVRVIDSWLSWSDALYVLDGLKGQQ